MHWCDQRRTNAFAANKAPDDNYKLNDRCIIYENTAFDLTTDNPGHSADCSLYDGAVPVCITTHLCNIYYDNSRRDSRYDKTQ